MVNYYSFIIFRVLIFLNLKIIFIFKIIKCNILLFCNVRSLQSTSSVFFKTCLYTIEVIFTRLSASRVE